jgi:peptidoglycan biosynthesis protein MviN/MurJ (putative lipid II flippase)
MGLFVRAYYSRGQTMLPLMMNVVCAIITVAISYYLVHLFQHNFFFQNFSESLLKVSGISGTVVLMLPLGYSIGTIINMIAHWVGFGREYPTYSPRVLRVLFETISSSLIMGYIAYLCLNVFDRIFNITTTIGIFLQGFCSGVIGIAVGIIILYLLNSRELVEIWATLHKKIWRAKVLGPDAEVV